MLTEAEKAAGRAWRDAQVQALAARNEADPPDMVLPVFLRHVRHECTAREGRTVSFHFREVYLLSPEAGDVPAGRFAFIYREGACSDCHVTARSSAVLGTGCRVVDTQVRPPTGRPLRVRPSR